MKIDLHVHSSERSACGKAPEEDQVRAAIRAGLDAVVFTDHHRQTPQERLDDLNRRYAPFRVFGGVEITTDGEDVLVLGVRDAALEEAKWSYPDLHTFVRARGGFIAMAHPFRYHAQIQLDLDRYPPDAIELHSINTSSARQDQISAVAARLGIPTLCNSDAHTTDALGQYYNILASRPADEAALVALLKAGQFAGFNQSRIQSVWKRLTGQV
jgi:predicted metal-dependent phosphoesterase TrpH